MLPWNFHWAKNFGTQSGLLFKVGDDIRMTADANTNNYVEGKITFYDSSTGGMSLNITNAHGSGLFNDWTIKKPCLTMTIEKLLSKHGGNCRNTLPYSMSM